MLIDEIELHLHPKWQHAIIQKLISTFPGCQFVLTTHSPQVISNVEWVHLLNSEIGMDVTCERVRSFGKDSNRILETLMASPVRQIDTQNEFNQLFDLIDEGQLEAARNLREKIAQELLEEDPKLVRADWLIRRKEILNR